MTVKGTQARAGAKVPTHGSLPHLPPKAIIANPKRQQIWLPSFFCAKTGIISLPIVSDENDSEFCCRLFFVYPSKILRNCLCLWFWSKILSHQNRLWFTNFCPSSVAITPKSAKNTPQKLYSIAIDTAILQSIYRTNHEKTPRYCVFVSIANWFLKQKTL